MPKYIRTINYPSKNGHDKASFKICLMMQRGASKDQLYKILDSSRAALVSPVSLQFLYQRCDPRDTELLTILERSIKYITVDHILEARGEREYGELFKVFFAVA